MLEKVDTRQIPFVAGVELSFLSPGQQEIVMGAIEKTSCGRIDRQKALKLKDAANKNVLDEKTAEEILLVKIAVVRDNIIGRQEAGEVFRRRLRSWKGYRTDIRASGQVEGRSGE